MLLQYQDGEPFASGACPFRDAFAGRGNEIPKVIVDIEINGIRTEAVVDTGGIYLIVHPDLVDVGYTAIVTYDDRDHIFHGHLADTYDDVYFEGTSVEALERAFYEAVDDYLAYYEEMDRAPTKPFSGRLNIRMDADLHRRAHIAARRKGMSLNKLITKAISKEIE